MRDDELKPLIGFLNPLVVRYGDEGTWFLECELRYQAKSGSVYAVPVGFETDFASVPRALWSIFPPTGKWIKAAVLHDYLLFERIVPKRQADDLFSEASESEGVKGWQRKSMYVAVRAFSRPGHFK